MTVIDHPESALPGRLRGLHLFHYGGATCAQRVRFVLAEKGIRRGPDIAWDAADPGSLAPPDARSYVSRVVSLPRKQHLTPAYAAIHPHMVVPALVHDGVLHIESVDIVEYVEATWPEPSLVPRAAALRDECRALVAEARALHRAVRYVSFKWNLGGLGKLGKAEEAALRRLEAAGSPEQLVAFYGAFDRDEIPLAVFVEHLRQLERGFAGIEARLADGRPWLLGDDFSLADILWSLKVLRISECGYPFRRGLPRLHAWFLRLTARPSFREAVGRDLGVLSRALQLRAGLANALGRGIARVSLPPDALRAAAA